MAIPMIDVSPSKLQQAVERMHCCSVRLAQSVPIKETHAGATVWEGVVHVFDLVLLSQKVAANDGENHLFGKIHTSAMGGWNGSAEFE